MTEDSVDNVGSIGKVMRALDSPIRRMLLLIALEDPKTSQGCKEELLKRGFEIKFKESVYKDLQLLVEAGLVRKYYDNESKNIVYGSSVSTVVFDLLKWSIDFSEMPLRGV